MLGVVMYRRIGAFVAAGAAAAAVAAPSTAAAATKVVYAGGQPQFQGGLQKKYGAGVDNFLINRVTINTGDTVVWNGKSLSGGFHTVDFPKLGGSDLALFVPGKTVMGVNDFAGNPFWFNGKVKQLGFNPLLFKRIGGGVYNGSARADSGLPLSPKPVNFSLKFTKPGVYKYFCDVHYGMVGYVVVKPRGTKVPSHKADAAALRVAQAKYVVEAKRLDRTTVRRNNVSVGASGPGGIEVFAMFPSTLRVSTGTTVRFSMSKLTRETHTASFGPVSYLKPLANSLGAPVPSPTALYPSDPPGSITLNQSSHGNGFANTGAMDQDRSTPLPTSGTIKFTQPGTYHFVCLIHPFMHGTVVVR
jgi:plastocyanin